MGIIISTDHLISASDARKRLGQLLSDVNDDEKNYYVIMDNGKIAAVLVHPGWLKEKTGEQFPNLEKLREEWDRNTKEISRALTHLDTLDKKDIPRPSSVIMYLIDSDILIDYIRAYPPAVSFLDGLRKKDRSIAFLSQFELLKGCLNKSQEARINRFFKNFTVYPLNEKISKTALEIYRVKRWVSGIGIVDSFIAATALTKGITLVSRNIKHYKAVPSLKVETPY